MRSMTGAAEIETLPSAEPALRAIAMPADTNPPGDIFGGWLLSQMDLAGSTVVIHRAKSPVATELGTPPPPPVDHEVRGRSFTYI